MSIAEWNASRRTLPWLMAWRALSLLEAVSAALVFARLAFGPFSLSPRPLLWVLGVGGFFLAYLAVMPRSIRILAPGMPRIFSIRSPLLWVSSLSFTAVFVVALALIQFRPGAIEWVLGIHSPIQPYPAVVTGLLLLLVLLLKTVMVYLAKPEGIEGEEEPFADSADLAGLLAMLLLGVLQASVYIIPIGNAFLRFWAIADALTLGTNYPVTLTEDGPRSAGSPPYVYDLALFPLMLNASFALFGHNSMAGHLPGWAASALFPLSLYLLIREATGSRATALIFGTLASLFPYFRFWVLNLPDPDPILLTSGCFAAYFYLRALAWPERTRRWITAGIVAGILSLARPEGILYAACLGLGVVLSRPRLKNLAVFSALIGLFVLPMAAVWWKNFGFIWPQNYNRTLRMDYPVQNFQILRETGALGFYQRGLGLDESWAQALLVVFSASVILGTLAMVFGHWRLLPIVLPGIGNTALIFFANPYIPNTYHFADFFRHASFGIPFLVLASAYGCHRAYRYLARRGVWKAVAYAAVVLLMAAVFREGDILANPTATHRTGSTQVLTDYVYVSIQTVIEHPMSLPAVEYRWNGEANVAQLTSMPWPDAGLEFFRPRSMALDSRGRPFGYASVLAFLLALLLALPAEAGIGRKKPRLS